MEVLAFEKPRIASLLKHLAKVNDFRGSRRCAAFPRFDAARSFDEVLLLFLLAVRPAPRPSPY